MPMRDKMLASEIGNLTQAFEGVDLTPFESQAIKAISAMCATFESTELTTEDKDTLADTQATLYLERERDVLNELSAAMVGKNAEQIATMLQELPCLQQEHKTTIATLEAKIDALQSKKAIAALNEFERLMLGRSAGSGNNGSGLTTLDNTVLKTPFHKKGYRFASVSPTEFYGFSVEPETHSVTPLFSSQDIQEHPDLAETTTVQVKSATTARKVVSCFVDGYRGNIGLEAVISGFNARFENLNAGGVGRDNRLAKPLQGKASDWLLIANTGVLPGEKERTTDTQTLQIVQAQAKV